MLHSDTDDCIEWPFLRDKSNYGKVKYDGRHVTASFAATDMTTTRPSPIHESAHSCHNPPCVNPRHLRWALPIENSLDSSIALRNDRKLDAEDVRRIRSAPELSNSQLATELGVSKSCISSVRTGRTWKWLDAA